MVLFIVPVMMMTISMKNLMIYVPDWKVLPILISECPTSHILEHLSMWEWERYLSISGPSVPLYCIHSHPEWPDPLQQDGTIRRKTWGVVLHKTVLENPDFINHVREQLFQMILPRLDRGWRSRFWTLILPKAELVLNLWNCFERIYCPHNIGVCRIGIYLFTVSQLYWTHYEQKTDKCRFCRPQYYEDNISFQSSFTSSRPILPLAISMFRTLTSTLCPTWGVSFEITVLSHDWWSQDFPRQFYATPHLKFSSWSSHLAGVDQATLGASEYNTRVLKGQILINTFPTPTSTNAPKCVTLDTLKLVLVILFNQVHRS
jgi:hypothetical protein